MAKVEVTEVEQPEKKETVRLIPEERLQEIVNILLPYGYSHYGNNYTGVSPYIGSMHNVITIVANYPYFSVFTICMERFTEDDKGNEDDCLGYYKGIMKLIAPELYSTNEVFAGPMNTLEFGWAEDEEQNNRFPVKVVYSTDGTMIK